MTLLELAERCEQASGADYALGREILFATGWTEREYDEIGEEPGYVMVAPDGSIPQQYPQPTHSLDAAMTLVPDEAGLDAAGERFRLEGWTTNGVHAPHVRATAWVAGARRVYAATPALALCAAALRARAASAGKTRRAETGTGSVGDEHATGEAGDAQKEM